MSKTRYIIVKADYTCPTKFNDKISFDFVCQNKGPFKNEQCKKCRYGDTKEQLVRKVAQVLYRENLEWYKKNIGLASKSKIDEPFCRSIQENCLEKATKIIEFLGIEE